MHFGPTGAGHYVKMVHNGVEYGLMQAYAEGFDIFDHSEYELDNAKIAHLWGQGSVVRSWLCELAARAFELDGNELEAIEGWTDDSGEGRWTIQDATDHDVPTPVITASLYSRFRSRGNGDFADRVLAALRNQFGGHAVKASPKGANSAAAAKAAPKAGKSATAAKAAPKGGKSATAAKAAPKAGGAGAGKPARGRSFWLLAAQRREDGREALMAVTAGRPTERTQPENPLTAGWSASRSADHACDLRRHGGSRTAQTAAGALQPRARRRAARALLPGRGGAQEKAHDDYRRECEEAIDRFSRASRTRRC